MDKDLHPLTARFTAEEYQLLEKARLRFRYPSLAQLLHDAALHYAGHRRDTIRPVRAWKYNQEGGTAAGPLAADLDTSEGLDEGKEE